MGFEKEIGREKASSGGQLTSAWSAFSGGALGRQFNDLFALKMYLQMTQFPRQTNDMGEKRGRGET